MRVSAPLKSFCIVLFLSSAFYAAFPQSDKCPRGKQIFWYLPNDKLDAQTSSGFSDKIFKELVAPLADIGYCLKQYNKHDTLSNSPLYRENLLMHIFISPTAGNHGSAIESREQELVVVITQLKDMNKTGTVLTSLRPLLSMAYSSNDMDNLLIVFEKKIVENLHKQYICNVIITSEPEGVAVTTTSGLRDVTPLEWVVGLGKLQIQCNLKGYLPYKKEILLDRPAAYNYFIQMKKKQLYNSKFFISALGMGVATGVSYSFEAYYYDKYKKLNENDRKNDPQSFERLWNKVSTCESIALTCLGTCVSLLCLSIWF